MANRLGMETQVGPRMVHSRHGVVQATRTMMATPANQVERGALYRDTEPAGWAMTLANPLPGSHGMKAMVETIAIAWHEGYG
mmetsp:Transcript_56157/g.131485  ORF Transcript_56157/g.131485 Transcript_56157/m.131485 type:complete len:82 (-) Transcript_56157:4-249(-)